MVGIRGGTVPKLVLNYTESKGRYKMRNSYRRLLREEIFYPHKLALQELQKFVKDWSDRLWVVTNKLKENSDIGQYGHFCEDYPEYVALYWYCGGRKLQPTKAECKARIENDFDILDIDMLDDAQKWDLFRRGVYDRG